jgi:50S ribosomal protein L16 3-hydroxylase
MMTQNRTLPHLDGLTAREFLQTYWQKKPLLVRNAFPRFAAPLTRAEVLELACREEAESRMITNQDGTWSMAHGPFRKRDFTAVRNLPWTVLIQDTQHFSYEAHALLAKFNFIPHARIDDLMVSLANRGGGVGPHFDSYDVFLLQGEGERRWQISAQRNLTLVPDAPLKILKRFKPAKEWVLKTGDMLYLPPGYAHHGISESDTCMTWSIGFRAPSHQELTQAFLDFARDEIALPGHYADPGLKPTGNPGAIDAAMRAQLMATLTKTANALAGAALQERFLGRFLTEAKPHVVFDPPDELTAAAFTRALRREGVTLDLRTRLLSLRGAFFINGEELSVPAEDRAVWQTLADTRRLTPESSATLALQTIGRLKALYEAGYLGLGQHHSS